MGTYKVPQNVEAEDKILGPLSMKQFIYAMIGVAYGLLTFAILHSLSLVLWGIIGLPPMLALLGLGLYQREDQPLETFVVAIADFFVRPRQRLWQKEPISEVFRLEPPPPKAEQALRDPRQVRSQLAELADLVDTRGWSVKEPELQEPDETPVVDLRDRIGSEVLAAPPAIAPMSEVSEADDILSGQTVAAQGLNTLIENTVQSVRAEALEKMHAKTAAPVAVAAGPAAISAPPATSAARQPAAPVATPPAANPTAAPVAAPAGQPAAVAAPAPTATPSISGSTAAPSGDILKLATEGGDLTVAQIAAQARRYSTLNEGQSVSLRHADAI